MTNKYLCITCAVTFDHKTSCDMHLYFHPDHLFVKKNLHGRLEDFFLSYYDKKWWRIAGFCLIHGVFVYHFDYSFWEYSLSALGLGLLL